MSTVQTASDLRPGDAVIFNWGAHYAPARGLVLGQYMRGGHVFTGLTVEMHDAETGEPSYHPHTLEATSRPTVLGIGWQPAGDE